MKVDEKGYCLCSGVGKRSRLGGGAVGFFVLAVLVAVGRRAVRRL